MADAQGLGPCGRDPVEVQVLSPAPGFFGDSRISEKPACNHFATISIDCVFDADAKWSRTHPLLLPHGESMILAIFI